MKTSRTGGGKFGDGRVRLEDLAPAARRQAEAQIAKADGRSRPKCRSCGGAGTIKTDDGGAFCPDCRRDADTVDDSDLAMMEAQDADAARRFVPRGRCSPTAGGSPIVSPGGSPRRPWSAACPTVVDGIRFPSRMEARVFARLLRELRPGERLYRQVRLPLLAHMPGTESRLPSWMTVDFAVVSMREPEDYACPGGEWTRLSAEHFLSGIGEEAGTVVRPVNVGIYVRWIEAKGQRKSRDWKRGRDAWEATWGPISEVDR